MQSDQTSIEYGTWGSLMNLTTDIRSAPRGITGAIEQEIRTKFAQAPHELLELLTAIGSASPYLRQLILQQGDWILVHHADLDAAVQDVHVTLAQVAPSEAKPVLRRAKQRMALLLALADLGGVWGVMEITAHLTRFADACVQAAFEAALEPALRRGKIPSKSIADLPALGGMFVLAMGKMGAYELNYSSDIDLICLFDETQFHHDDVLEARSQFVKVTRQAMGILSDKTADGYVFRTDLRLRPDPAVTPVCLASGAAMSYYESLGRAWERAAFIKARVCAGDQTAGARFLEGLRPFVWRRHLDFAAVEDAHNMRLRIRQDKGFHGALTARGHHVKLGRGGIREIEFFAQTHQLIAGGRDPDLRSRQTLVALGELADKNWLPRQTSEKLEHHYQLHRQLEHRIQMIHDAQTHSVPTSDEEFARLAALMGMDEDALTRDITARFDEVHHLIEEFFAPDPTADALSDPFSDPITEGWHSYPALRSDRAVQVFTRIWPHLKRRVDQSPDAHETLRALDQFLSNLPAGVQLFSLFEANPALLDLLCDIMSSSPELAQYLSRNAQVFDAVIAGEFFDPWPTIDQLRTEIHERVAREADYEAQLDTLRSVMKEYSFRVGVHLLKQILTPVQAMAAYSDIAQSIVQVLWPLVQEQFAAKHGPPPGQGAVIVAMGSLGARRLHARSDLDLIVIYDPQDEESSTGPRPLDVRSYYARLTKSMITALTAQTARGRLYEVDMRLRPSGNKGPVATSLSSFRDYQSTQAWVWEHLALTRARVIAGPEALRSDVSAALDDVIGLPREAPHVIKEALVMRDRIFENKQASSLWDMKFQQGSLQDLELLGQLGALLRGQRSGDLTQGISGLASYLSTEDLTKLHGAAQLWGDLHVSTKLLIGTPPADESAFSAGGVQLILGAANKSDIDQVKLALNQAGQHVLGALTALKHTLSQEDPDD